MKRSISLGIKTPTGTLWRIDCRGKHGFKTEFRARLACRLIRFMDGENMHPYRCRVCRRWHLGH